MEDDREEALRRLAYSKWEREGRPEGQHERHWYESESDIAVKDSSLPQTYRSGEDGHVGAGDGDRGDDRPEQPLEGVPGAFGPGELASANK